MPTRVHLHTLGCPKNRVDSEVMLGTLVDSGFRFEPDPAKADVIVVNTCGFIGDAKEESVDAIVELAGHKATGRCRKLVVAGCLVQRHAEELAKALPEVDHFLGTGAYGEIAKVVADAQAKRLVIPDPDFVQTAASPRINSMPSHTAYLKVSEGCDRTCAFCIIPQLRGPQKSRPIADLVAEAERLASQGTVELSLVAQDLTAYGEDLPGRKVRLHDLLPRLGRVDGIRWIRLHYAYPRSFPDALVDVIAGEPRIVKYLDMPLQHASDRLLRAMKRGGNAATMRRILAKLRKRIPGIALRTSLIVGLPGETEADFRELLAFVKEQQFERLGVFEFSPEEGTPAATMPGQVRPEVKRARFGRIMEAQKAISRRQQRALVGRRLEVLVEGRSEESEHLLAGRHAQQAPEIDGITYVNDGLAWPGEIVTVEVTDAMDYDVVGRVVARDPRRSTRRLPKASAKPPPHLPVEPPRQRGLPIVG